jgi:protein SCO1
MNRFGPLLLLALAACGQADAGGEPPLAGASIGGPFRLTDGAGRTVTDRSFMGRYPIMYFGYTFCPDVCPTDMAAIAAGLRQVERSDPAKAAKVVPVFVTVDPERDTPEVVGKFVRAFHPRAVGLTGSPETIAAVAKSYAVFAQKGEGTKDGYLVNHGRAAYLMGPDGKPIALAGADGGPAEVARTIERWVK